MAGRCQCGRDGLIVVKPLALGACGGDEEGEPSPATEKLRPDNFSDSTNIDNKYSPLVPGTQFIYEGAPTAAGRRPTR